jgi:hypothetical protein
MRRIFVLSLLASAVSSPASAQLFQPGYPNTSQPAAASAPSNDVAPARYVVPPRTIWPPQPLRRAAIGRAGDAPDPERRAAGCPLEFARRRSFPRDIRWPDHDGTRLSSLRAALFVRAAAQCAGGLCVDQSGQRGGLSHDPKYLRQVVPYPGVEKPGTIIIDTPNKFLYLIENGCRALRLPLGGRVPPSLRTGERYAVHGEKLREAFVEKE